MPKADADALYFHIPNTNPLCCLFTASSSPSFPPPSSLLLTLFSPVYFPISFAANPYKSMLKAAGPLPLLYKQKHPEDSIPFERVLLPNFHPKKRLLAGLFFINMLRHQIKVLKLFDNPNRRNLNRNPHGLQCRINNKSHSLIKYR
jgi:hypothetical protein